MTTVRDEIKNYIDRNDEVLVIDVTGDGWASNFSDETTEWMKANLRRTGGLRRAA